MTKRAKILLQPSSRGVEKLFTETLHLDELLRASEIQQLFISYFNLVNIPTGIVDINGNVFVASPWHRICTRFHRSNPATCARCIESDAFLASQLEQGNLCTIHTCNNGLKECAAPITIEGKHVANLFIGQFFTKEPNQKKFRCQAEEFGFDVEGYLSALKEVPIVDERRIPVIVDMILKTTQSIIKLAIERKHAVESEARQSIILDTIPQSVFWKNVDGKYLGCNLQFAKVAGLANTGEIVGKTDFDLPWAREETNAYRAVDKEVVSSRQSRLHIIESAQDENGNRVTVDTSKIPLLDANGDSYGVVGIFDDITERIKTELELEQYRKNLEKMVEIRTKALRESEAKYRTLIDHALSVVLEWDPGGNVLYLNPYGLGLFGFDMYEITGRSVVTTIGAPIDLAGVNLKDRIAEIQHDPSKFCSSENENLRRNGEKVWVAWTNRGIYGVDGELIKIISFGMDRTEQRTAEQQLHIQYRMLQEEITRRKEAETNLMQSHVLLEQRVMERTGELTQINKQLLAEIAEREQAEEMLRESEARFRTAFMTSAVAFVLVEEATGRLLEVNDYFLELYGYTRAEVIGRTSIELGMWVTPEARANFIAQLELHGKVENFELVSQRKNGKEFWLLYSASRLTSANSEGLRLILGALHDISKRKDAEGKIVEYVKQLEGMLESTLQAVSSMVEMRDPYTAGHERRVGIIAADIAREMGWPEGKCNELALIGLVHDIGKIAIPTEILSKPGRLTQLEYEMVKTHAQRGFEILKNVQSPMPVAEIIREHHERIDGSGYPQGLTGEKILIEARILAVADVLESMASHRPYRPALGIEAAIAEIEGHSGTWYDENIVDAMLRLIRDKGYNLPA